MTSQHLRRALLVAASGGAYFGAVYLTYNYMLPPRDEEENEAITSSSSSSSSSCSCFSHVSDPCRTQTFERIAYAYDDEIGKDELVMGINLLRRALLFFHARGNVLEVGAGTGRNLPYYPGPSKVQSIVLSDTSDQMLQQARRKLSKNHDERFSIMVADAANMSMYDDDTFDTIIDSFGLCSFDDPVAVLRELQRICRPDGKILLLEHGRTKTYDGLSKYLDKNAERHAKNWGCVWNRDIDQILADAGLSIERLDTWHFGTTYYVVCRPGNKQTNKSTPTTNLLKVNA